MHAYNLAMIQPDRTGISCTVRVMVLVLIMRTFNVVNMQKQWETWLTNPGFSNNIRRQPNTPWWYPKTTWLSLNSRGGCHSLVRWKASTPWTWSSGAWKGDWPCNGDDIFTEKRVIYQGIPWAEGMFQPGCWKFSPDNWWNTVEVIGLFSQCLCPLLIHLNIHCIQGHIRIHMNWWNELTFSRNSIYIVMLNTTSAPLLLPFFPFPLGWPTRRFKKACLAKVRRQDAIRLDQL